MSTEVIVFIAFLAVVNAGVLIPAGQAVVDNDHQYTFGYSVDDPYTGDSKSQVETKIGGVVKGQYSLNEPDGTRRIVDYTADDIHGFNAVVRKNPQVQTHVLVPAVETKIAAPTPVVSNVSPVVEISSVTASPIVEAKNSAVTKVTNVPTASVVSHLSAGPVSHVSQIHTVIPETRITQTSHVVQAPPLPYSVAAYYTTPVRRYTYSVPHSYGFWNTPEYYSPYPYSFYQ
ncbi:pupal cuticle protein Edg-84A-like [Diorhabda carinulata]|uniref:pupal cuticle protein Edg-84A-like n=1 Tax=Diorhabda carinulata TaxID=1163345 RepID=UPI0025A13110|nr:pupal cuticle protein Edg-84A-like [Diorhabda carinulata]